MQTVCKRLLQYLYSHLSAKIMLVYLLIFAVPMLVVYSSMYSSSRSSAMQDAGRQMLVSLKNISDTTDEVLRSVSFIELQMQSDTVFSDYSFSLHSAGAEAGHQNFLLKEQIGMSLYKLYLSNPHIQLLQLYHPYANVLFSSGIGSTRQMIATPNRNEIEQVLGDDFSHRHWYLQTENGQPVFVSFSTPFYSNNPNLRLHARTVASTDALQKRIEEYFPGEQVTVFVQQPAGGRMLLRRANEYAIQILPESGIISGESGWESFEHHREVWLTAWHRSEYTGWYYAASAPLTYFNTSVSVINNYRYYFIITLTTIFLISMLFLTIYIVKPMTRISRRMRQAEQGDLSVRIYGNRSDELGYIGHRFNDLMESIDNLIYENYETRMTKQDFELKFIQTQLKEHFIYNTLDSIHWIATQHNVPQISHIIFDLSRFFRLTLNQGKDFIPLDQVAEILHSYVALLNVRMDDMIDITITIDPQIGKEPVVKYLFQPLLENAVVHGLTPKHGGKIKVEFSALDLETLRCVVRDNGAGIYPAELEDIVRCIERDNSDGRYFALLNINRQLRLYFENNYRFQIDSLPKQGTCVTMEFPRKRR